MRRALSPESTIWWFLLLFCVVNLLRIIFCLLYAVVLSCRPSVSGVCEDLQATNPEIQMAEDVKLRSLLAFKRVEDRRISMICHLQGPWNPQGLS